MEPRKNYDAKLEKIFHCLFVLAVLAVFAGCRPDDTAPGVAQSVNSPNTLTPAEEAEGWRLLFDGNSFSGWRGFNIDSIPAGHWIVEDGAIKKIADDDVKPLPDGSRPEGSDLITVEAFRDYELVFEWLLPEGRGNSGIKYNVDEGMSSGRHALGFEYQIIDPRDDLGPKHSAASLYDIFPASSDAAIRPAGEWNESRIVFEGNRGEHWLNGVKVVEYELGTAAMDSALAQSKFRDNERFGEKRTGHIVITDHNDSVWYRNIRIRPLG